jgi:hypothetical protein
VTTARVVEILDENATAVPFTYLGPADLERHESERWRDAPSEFPERAVLHPMPAEMFEMKLDNSAH